MAFALYLNRQFADAGPELARLAAAASYAGRPDVLAAPGQCQSENRQVDAAVKSHTAATAPSPDTSDFWLGLAKATVQAGDLPRAAIAVRRAISLDGDNAAAQSLLGYVQLRQGQLTPALSSFQTVSRLDSNDGVSAYAQGYLLARLGRPEEADRMYAQAQALDPKARLATNRLRPGETAEEQDVGRQ